MSDFVIENGMLEKYTGNISNVIIPDGVTSIGYCAFKGSGILTSVTIPDSVTRIGDSAFYGCSRMTNITLPDSLISIGGSAFHGCDSMTDITLPDSLISIGAQGMTPIASVLAGAVLQSFCSTALLLACTLGFTVTAAMLMANRQVRDL